MSKSTYLAVALLLVVNVYAEQEENSGKVLSFFNVVKFPNALCKGSSSRNGTCYTKEECTDRKGTASGSCADGFGVCCVVTLGCGGKSAENNTYFVLASTTAPATSCSFTICPVSSNICRIRLDMTTFVTAGPTTIATATTVGTSIGDCKTDAFTAPGAPVICGTNTGHHLYIDSNGVNCAVNSFTFGGGTSTRQVDVMVKQYDCTSNAGGPKGCLQYHTGTSGTLATFNWAASNQHLSNQEYDICIRRASGKCSICYTTVGLTIASTFGLSNNPTVTKGASSAEGKQCITDYIQIPIGNTATIAKATTQAKGFSRLCGRFLQAAASVTKGTATISATVCTNARPFKVSVVTDGGEVISTKSKVESDELTTQPYGALGFSLVYNQEAC